MAITYFEKSIRGSCDYLSFPCDSDLDHGSS